MIRSPRRTMSPFRRASRHHSSPNLVMVEIPFFRGHASEQAVSSEAWCFGGQRHLETFVSDGALFTESFAEFPLALAGDRFVGEEQDGWCPFAGCVIFPVFHLRRLSRLRITSLSCAKRAWWQTHGQVRWISEGHTMMARSTVPQWLQSGWDRVLSDIQDVPS